MVIKLTPVVDLTELDRTEIRALSSAVYPPEETDDWLGRHLEWSRPEWCVRIWGSEGNLVSYVGIVLREGTLDNKPVLMGGVGGVATHPTSRRQGYAAAGIQEAVEFFRQNPRVAFALLVCQDNLMPYYTRLGWQKFGGELIVRQHGNSELFTFNRVMTIGIALEAPTSGTIDLQGPPW